MPDPVVRVPHGVIGKVARVINELSDALANDALTPAERLAVELAIEDLRRIARAMKGER
jgi:hypothetical protein